MTTTPAELTVKARLRNFGDGVIVIADDAIKFHVETGRFKKHRKIAREIPMADVGSVERQGNDLSIVWKGATEMFVLEQAAQAEPVYERITATLKELTKAEEKEGTTDQKRVELAPSTLKALETADSLFDILRNLHGRVDWNLVENNLRKSEDNVKNLASQANSICLDITPLSAAVQERHPKEIAQKTYDVLKTMHEHFDGMASTGEIAEQSLPNHRNARLVIQASYVLNDMLLGAIVGDDAVEKEDTELLQVLDDLAKTIGSRLDVNVVRASFDEICAEKEKRASVVERIRLIIGQQMKELISPTSSSPATKH